MNVHVACIPTGQLHAGRLYRNNDRTAQAGRYVAGGIFGPGIEGLGARCGERVGTRDGCRPSSGARGRNGSRFVYHVTGHSDIVGSGEAGDWHGQGGGSSRDRKRGDERRSRIGQCDDYGSTPTCRYVPGGIFGPGIEDFGAGRGTGVRSRRCCRPAGGAGQRRGGRFGHHVAGHSDVVGCGETADGHSQCRSRGRNREGGDHRRTYIGRYEGYVHPIVGGVPARIGEPAAGPVSVDPVWPVYPAAECVQRRRVHSRRGEEISVRRIMPVWSEVGDDVRCISGNRYRSGKAGLLPARGGLVRECHGSEQRAGASPQVPGVGTRVGRPLVEAHSGNRPRYVRAEFHSQFHGTGVGIHRAWCGRGGPYT